MNVKTAGFEGPLDLLLHLIKKLEIDIYDIPMAEITEQYLQYVHTMHELQLDVASEYLVMAATLLSIKSEMLLPKYDVSSEEDYLDEEFETDPREELVIRLIEYRKFKEAADELKEREKERSLMFTKPPSDLSEYVNPAANVHYNGQKVTIYDMLGAFHKLLRRQRLHRPIHTRVSMEELSVEKRMDEILEYLHERRERVNFADLFPYIDKKMLIVSFLSILELMKQQKIIVSQDGNFDEIWITLTFL